MVVKIWKVFSFGMVQVMLMRKKCGRLSQGIHQKIFKYNLEKSKLSLIALESFLSSWGKRIPQKSLTLVITKNYLTNYDFYTNEENIMIIEKYKKLGIINEFKIETYDTENYLFYL